MPPPLLQLTDIRFTLGGKPLLEGVDLQVGRGDRICLVGRNGSGKSTLLQDCCGLYRSRTAESGIPAARRHAVRSTFRRSRIFTGFVDRPGLRRGGTWSDSTMSGARASLLEGLGLTGEDEDPAHHCPAARLRRAALARTLAPEPDILLLDEPTNHLDLPAIEWLENELKELSASRSADHSGQPRPALSHQPVAHHRLARPRTGPADRTGFRGLRGVRDETLEQEELDRHKLDRKIVGGRALGALRRHRAAQAQPVGRMAQPAGPTQGPCATTASHRRYGQVRPSPRARPRASSSSTRSRLTKRYGEPHGGEAISPTRVLRGDRVGVIGPNGAGKTTLHQHAHRRARRPMPAT